MKLGATEVVITKNKGFEEQLTGQLDLIIVRCLCVSIIDAELITSLVHCRCLGGYPTEGIYEDPLGAWEAHHGRYPGQRSSRSNI
jgi:hypothetical protein